MSNLTVGKAERNIKLSARTMFPVDVQMYEHKKEEPEEIVTMYKRNGLVAKAPAEINRAEERTKQQQEAYFEHHKRNSDRPH